MYVLWHILPIVAGAEVGALTSEILEEPHPGLLDVRVMVEVEVLGGGGQLRLVAVLVVDEEVGVVCVVMRRGHNVVVAGRHGLGRGGRGGERRGRERGRRRDGGGRGRGRRQRLQQDRHFQLSVFKQ